MTKGIVMGMEIGFRPVVLMLFPFSTILFITM